jgi:hypothetical protein
MATYDFTKGSGAISNLDYGRFFVARIPIVVTEIIASDATLVAAAKITAADIIQLWDIPAKTVLLVSMAALKIVVAGTAGGTVDVGLAGGVELFSGVSNAAAAGVIYTTAHNATWGTDNYGAYDFESTDTIDIQFIADETVGEMVLYLPGYYLD